MDNNLTVVEGQFLEVVREPASVLADAQKAAKALTTVIEQKPRKVKIGNQIYLEYEDWQTVAQFYGYTAKTRDAVPVEINGIKGAKAEADLVDFRTGLIVGGAEAYCMRDEENWGTKPWFQLASMAQTRAGSKAIRNRMAWVVVLAGYAGVPAEEMIAEKIDESKHYCTEHKVNFFKKGRMKGYAHPIVDENGKTTGEWCNEETPPEHIVVTMENVIDCLEELEKRHPRKWGHIMVSENLFQKYGAEGGTLMEQIEKLEPKDKADVLEHISDAINV